MFYFQARDIHHATNIEVPPSLNAVHAFIAY
jgi:hypothetical protein